MQDPAEICGQRGKRGTTVLNARLATNCSLSSVCGPSVDCNRRGDKPEPPRELFPADVSTAWGRVDTFTHSSRAPLTFSAITNERAAVAERTKEA